jgi:hypothetical protein
LNKKLKVAMGLEEMFEGDLQTHEAQISDHVDGGLSIGFTVH